MELLLKRLPPALRIRDFRLFWIGAVISATGSQFTTVAMAWQMYQLTNSPMQIGLLGLSRAVAQIALSLVGGVLADAMDRRRFMLVLQVYQAMICAGLAVLTFVGHVTPVALYATSVLLAIGTGLESPPRQAIVPNLVPNEHLTSAVALNSVQRGLAMIAGPSIAGVVLALAGVEWCYSINAVLWMVMFAVLMIIRLRPGDVRRASTVSLKALSDGLRFVMKERVVLIFMILDFGATLFSSASALYPIFARDSLKVGQSGLGLLYAAPAAGALAMATVMSVRSDVRKTGRWVLLGVAFYAVCTIGFAFSHTLWWSLVLLAGTGAGNQVSGVLRGTTNQLLTPDELRGRVSSINAIFVMGGPQLGQFESGVVGQIWNVPMSAFTGGLGALILVLVLASITGIRKFSLQEWTQRTVKTLSSSPNPP
jgi:MFS family permease